MWAQRYGHTNAQPIWGFCDESMTAEPGVQTVVCSVPWVDDLWIGTGVRAENEALCDALWEACTATWKGFLRT